MVRTVNFMLYSKMRALYVMCVGSDGIDSQCVYYIILSSIPFLDEIHDLFSFFSSIINKCQKQFLASIRGELRSNSHDIGGFEMKVSLFS
jgi:hypothetical protein